MQLSDAPNCNYVANRKTSQLKTFKVTNCMYPNCLIINWDQTAVKYVPISEWIMERVGCKHVEMADLKIKGR